MGNRPFLPLWLPFLFLVIIIQLTFLVAADEEDSYEFQEVNVNEPENYSIPQGVNAKELEEDKMPDWFRADMKKAKYDSQSLAVNYGMQQKPSVDTLLIENIQKEISDISAQGHTNYNDDFKYSSSDYKPITTYEYEYSGNGFNRYHAGGWIFVIAFILCCIRFCLFCCRNQAKTPRNTTRGVIFVRETPVTAIIINRQRQDEENLLTNAEAPVDDPPAYADCANLFEYGQCKNLVEKESV